MTRPRPFCDVMTAVAAMAALSIAASPVLAGAEACPAPVEDHLPKAPQGAAEISLVKFCRPLTGALGSCGWPVYPGLKPWAIF